MQKSSVTASINRANTRDFVYEMTNSSSININSKIRKTSSSFASSYSSSMPTFDQTLKSAAEILLSSNQTSSLSSNKMNLKQNVDNQFDSGLKDVCFNFVNTYMNNNSAQTVETKEALMAKYVHDCLNELAMRKSLESGRTSNALDLNLQNSTTSSSSVEANTSNTFDLATYWQFRLILIWISLFVIVIGLIGNLVSFVVLVHPKMRISTNVFLSSLCVSGFIALLGLLINSIAYELCQYYAFPLGLLIIHSIYPYVYPIITTFQMASILLTVCVSVNQFICIYYGRMQNQSFNKKTNESECRSAFFIVLLMFFISIIYCVPYWLKFKYTQSEGLHPTKLGQNPLFNKIVHLWMYLPIVYIIPFTILIITNSYLVYKIMITRRRRKLLGIVDTNRTTNTAKRVQTNHNKSDQKANASTLVNSNRAKCATNNGTPVSVQAASPIECEEFLNKSSIDPKSYSKQNSNYLSVANHMNSTKPTRYLIEQTTTATNLRPEAVTQMTSHVQSLHASKVSRTAGMNITIMLIAVVFLFFVCQFPTLVLHIIQGLICTEVETVCASALYQYGVVISKFLLVCNLTFNFACYCFFSAKFRQVLVEIFSVYQYELKNHVNMNINQNHVNGKSGHNQLKKANSQQFSPEKQKFIDPDGR